MKEPSVSVYLRVPNLFPTGPREAALPSTPLLPESTSFNRATRSPLHSVQPNFPVRLDFGSYTALSNPQYPPPFTISAKSMRGSIFTPREMQAWGPIALGKRPLPHQRWCAGCVLHNSKRNGHFSRPKDQTGGRSFSQCHITRT